ncbi:MAG: endolytic transglycosylase MltG [Acidobacteria bacterium]|nr:endolytic transglycosylase MltG [Acidobacteriota bacterium]
MKRALAVSALVLLAAGGFVASALLSPYRGFEGEVFLNFPMGTPSGRIGSMLADAGVIRSRWHLLAARAIRPGVTLQAGEYRFEPPASVLEIFRRLERGDVFYHELTVPEGFNMFDIADAIEKLGLFPVTDFLAAAGDPQLIRDLAPQAVSLEGYLFPDKYRLTRQMSPVEACRMMTGEFRKVWKRLGSSADAHRTITLASLVEKESRLAEERALVAAVFSNRLRIGMKLDCDPTVVYAALLEGRWRGTIYKSDLASGNRWNTYRHPGLPPGPIANPGLESIRAALAPAASDALYFVARPDGSGGHTFSATIAQHNHAAAAYRRAQRRQ